MSFLKRVPGRFAPITCSHRVDSPHLFAIISSPDPLVRWAIVTTERPSSVRPLTFHILINSSEATGPIWTKLWWNGPWMAPSKIVNKSYNIQNTNICNDISFFKALLINEGETTRGERE
jgi:hypothetical protein